MDSQEKVLTQEGLTVNIAPDQNCKHCYGRGSEGRNVLTNRIVLCRCVVKKIDKLRKGRVNVRSLRAPEQGRDNSSVEERREGSGWIRLSNCSREEKGLGNPEENASERGKQKEQILSDIFDAYFFSPY